MATAAELFRLEQLDTRLEGRETALNELRRRWQRDPQLHALEVSLERLQATVQKDATVQRSLESDLADIQARIERDNRRMYGGTIVDSRELTSLEREIAHHIAQRGAVEERLLETMERLEGEGKELASLEAEVAEARKRREADAPDIQREGRAVQAEIAALRSEREALAATIDAPSLTMYTRLRSSSGHAVSTVSNGVCQWCRVTLLPKDVQHARSTLVTCNNCARILYVP